METRTNSTRTTGARKKQTPYYHFEPFPMSNKMVGLFVALPLYFYVLAEWFLFPLFQSYWDLHPSMDSELIDIYYNLVFEGIMVIILLLIMFPILRQSAIDLRIYGFVDFIKNLVVSFIIFYAANYITNVLFLLFYGDLDTAAQNQESIAAMVPTSPHLMVLTAVLLGPFVEEMLFRGVIFRTIREASYPLALIVSSALFAWIHVSAYVLAGDYQEIFMAIPYFGMGIGLGIVYERRRNLLLCVLIHVIHNAGAMAQLLG